MDFRTTVSLQLIYNKIYKIILLYYIYTKKYKIVIKKNLIIIE